MRASKEATRTPAKVQPDRDPNKHYVIVGNRHPQGTDFQPKVDDYLGGICHNPNDPDCPTVEYEVASTDKAVTGHAGRTLLACDKKAFQEAEQYRVMSSNAALDVKADLDIPGYQRDLDRFGKTQGMKLDDIGAGLPDESDIENAF